MLDLENVRNAVPCVPRTHQYRTRGVQAQSSQTSMTMPEPIVSIAALACCIKEQSNFPNIDS